MTAAAQLGLCVALQAEAAPAIRKLSLKRVAGDERVFRAFDVYSGMVKTADGAAAIDVRLIISGIGKVRAASATTCLASLLSPHLPAALLNVGVSGDAGSRDIGTWWEAVAVEDMASDRRYYLDAPFDIFPTATVATVDRPQHKDTWRGSPTALVDMEAAGFADIALRFVGPSRTFVWKVVADHLSPVVPVREAVTGWMEQVSAAVVGLGEHVMQSVPPEFILTAEELEGLRRIAADYRLTWAQTQKLKRAAENAKVSRGGISLGELAHRFPLPTSKEEVRRVFRQITAALGAGGEEYAPPRL